MCRMSKRHRDLRVWYGDMSILWLHLIFVLYDMSSERSCGHSCSCLTSMEFHRGTSLQSSKGVSESSREATRFVCFCDQSHSLYREVTASSRASSSCTLFFFFFRVQYLKIHNMTYWNKYRYNSDIFRISVRHALVRCKHYVDFSDLVCTWWTEQSCTRWTTWWIFKVVSLPSFWYVRSKPWLDTSRKNVPDVWDADSYVSCATIENRSTRSKFSKQFSVVVVVLSFIASVGESKTSTSTVAPSVQDWNVGMVVRWRQGALPSVENLRCNINNNSVNIQ